MNYMRLRFKGVTHSERAFGEAVSRWATQRTAVQLDVMSRRRGLRHRRRRQSSMTTTTTTTMTTTMTTTTTRRRRRSPSPLSCR